MRRWFFSYLWLTSSASDFSWQKTYFCSKLPPDHPNACCLGVSGSSQTFLQSLTITNLHMVGQSRANLSINDSSNICLAFPFASYELNCLSFTHLMPAVSGHLCVIMGGVYTGCSSDLLCPLHFQSRCRVKTINTIVNNQKGKYSPLSFLFFVFISL